MRGTSLALCLRHKLMEQLNIVKIPSCCNKVLLYERLTLSNIQKSESPFQVAVSASLNKSATWPIIHKMYKSFIYCIMILP